MSFFSCTSSSTAKNEYGLSVIKRPSEFKRTTQDAEGKELVDLRKEIPSIIVDLKYTGTDNFTHEKLYPALKTTYLRRDAAAALKQAASEFAKKNLKLKIFDAYRPYSVTRKMWKVVPDERYAANPAKGSGHNRGIAVDLTLVTADSELSLDMGTGFDNFSDTAHTDFQLLPNPVLQNRRMLIRTMKKYGFISLDTEWWHFYLKNANKYELLDLSFAQVKRFAKR